MAVLWRYPAQPQVDGVGTAVTAASLTSGLGAQSQPVLPGGIYPPGAHLSLLANGEYTSTSSTPTLTLGFYMGPVGTTIGSDVVIAVTGANAISASGTLWPFTLRWDGTFRTLATLVAANGVLHGHGELLFGSSLTAWATTPFPATAAARTVSTVNTQVNNQLNVGVTLSATTGSPSVWITDFFAELTG